LASKAAKRGLKAEKRLINAINSMDELGKKLIKAIGDSLGLKFTLCSAYKGPPRAKTDIVITRNGKSTLISVKEFDVKFDYNHVERHYMDFYAQKWLMPQNVYVSLKQFVGEINEQGAPISIERLEREAERLCTSPGKLSKKRRIFINQMNYQTRETIKEFFRSKKVEILKDAFINDENIEFFIVVKREGDTAHYYVLPTKDVLNVYSAGDVIITPRGSLQIGKVVLQRKGGDHRTNGGRVDVVASQLQFKIKPSECIKDRVQVAYETIHI
jgi:hypothetical protein